MRDPRLGPGYRNPLVDALGVGFFRGLPRGPGVYFMLGPGGQILYIGKAKSLRARVTSYSRAKPGLAPEHILEMIESVERIAWEERKSEAEAFARESELLHAIRPPFNIAGTEEAHYLYIAIRPGRKGRMDFRLTSHERIPGPGFEVFGCYKHRRRTKSGYTALLRLLHAAHARTLRYSMPARISGASPPWVYEAAVDAEWLAPLRRFLAGESRELLVRIVQRLLENDNVPRFMRPSLQDDIETVREFYARGPRETRRMRREKGLGGRAAVPREEMDRWISESVSLPRG